MFYNFVQLSGYLYYSYYFVVCITLDNLSYVSFLHKVGALTSKPFAYWARAWELATTYFVDIGSVLGEKIWADYKGLEIYWILPWLEFSISESFISDKTWFFYDGLCTNRVTKFFFWWKFILLPLYCFITFLQDPLFKKYLFKMEFFKKIIKQFDFSLNRENFFLFFFEMGNLFTFYKNLNSNFYFNRNIFNNWKFSLLLFTNLFFFSPKYFIRKKVSKFLNKIFYKKYCLILINFKKRFSFFKKYIRLLPISNWNLITGVLLSFFSTKKIINFLVGPALENFSFSYFSFLRKISISSYFININKFILGQSLFNFMVNFNKIFTFDLLLLHNVNVRLANPKLHFYIRKAVKLKELLVISVSNSDNLLFKHLSIASNLTFIQKVATGTTWVMNFFVKALKLGFFFNFDCMNLSTKILIIFIKEYRNFYYFSNIANKNNKLYLLTTTYFYYSSCFLNSNLLNTNAMSYTNKYMILKSLNRISRQTWNKNEIIFRFISNEEILEGVFFNKKKHRYLIKNNFNFLQESNLFSSKLSRTVDVVFPTNTLSENFFSYKNYKNRVEKSLFLKYAPWISWNFFNQINFIEFLKTFPFFWEWVFFYTYFGLLSIFYSFYLLLNSLVNSSLFFKKLLFKNILTFVQLMPKNFFGTTTISKIIKVTLEWNFWKSSLSFIKNSKYIQFGKTLASTLRVSFYLLNTN